MRAGTRSSSFPTPAKIQKQNPMGGQCPPIVVSPLTNFSSIPDTATDVGEFLTFRLPVARLLKREFSPAHRAMRNYDASNHLPLDICFWGLPAHDWASLGLNAIH